MPSSGFGRFTLGLHNIVLVFWVGGLWVVGFIVAPALFSQLDDRQLAGTLAGSIFSLMGWVGIAASLILLALYTLVMCSRWRVIVTVLMGLLVAINLFIVSPLVAINLFIVSPELAAIRDSVSSALVAGSDEYRRFGYLHGISSGIFLLISLLGLLLVVRMPDRS
jgi:uncharacterized membrane protein